MSEANYGFRETSIRHPRSPKNVPFCYRCCIYVRSRPPQTVRRRTLCIIYCALGFYKLHGSNLSDASGFLTTGWPYPSGVLLVSKGSECVSLLKTLGGVPPLIFPAPARTIVFTRPKRGRNRITPKSWWEGV